MPKVYILQDNPYAPKNFIPAQEYGDLLVIFDKHIPTISVAKSVPLMKDKMKSLSPEDYIVPTGHPALIAAAGSISWELIGHINLLIWDHQSSTYYPIQIGGKSEYQPEIVKAGQEAL